MTSKPALISETFPVSRRVSSSYTVNYLITGDTLFKQGTGRRN